MLASLVSRPLAAFPVSTAGRLPQCAFRGLLGVYLALWPVWSLSRPRRPFVIGVLQTMLLPPPSAPTATGWSDSCRAGFAPAEEWRLLTAHVKMYAGSPRRGLPQGSRGTPTGAARVAPTFVLKYNIRTRSLADPGTIEDVLAVENDVVPFDRADLLGAGLRPGLPW